MSAPTQSFVIGSAFSSKGMNGILHACMLCRSSSRAFRTSSGKSGSSCLGSGLSDSSGGPEAGRTGGMVVMTPPAAGMVGGIRQAAGHASRVLRDPSPPQSADVSRGCLRPSTPVYKNSRRSYLPTGSGSGRSFASLGTEALELPTTREDRWPPGGDLGLGVAGQGSLPEVDLDLSVSACLRPSSG